MPSAYKIHNKWPISASLNIHSWNIVYRLFRCRIVSAIFNGGCRTTNVLADDDDKAIFAFFFISHI